MKKLKLPDGSIGFEVQKDHLNIRISIMFFVLPYFFFSLIIIYSNLITQFHLPYLIVGISISSISMLCMITGIFLTKHKIRITIDSSELLYEDVRIMGGRQFIIPINQLKFVFLDRSIRKRNEGYLNEIVLDFWRVGVLTNKEKIIEFIECTYLEVNQIAEYLSKATTLPILDLSSKCEEKIIQPHETDKSIVEKIQDMDPPFVSSDVTIDSHLYYSHYDYNILIGIGIIIGGIFLPLMILPSTTIEQLSPGDVRIIPYLFVSIFQFVGGIIGSLYFFTIQSYVYVADNKLVFEEKIFGFFTQGGSSIPLDEIERIRVAYNKSMYYYYIEILTDKRKSYLRKYKSEDIADEVLSQLLQMIKLHLQEDGKINPVERILENGRQSID